MKNLIAINIGSQTTKFSSGFLKAKKKKYKTKDFQINILLNDIIDRNLPSVIQYKEINRLFGGLTKLGYRKYHLSTFNNLSRLIGFIYKLKINDDETKYFITKDNYNKEEGTFNFSFNEKEYKLFGDNIVCSFISKLDEKIKSQLNTNEKQTYIFTIPDYYTLYQKEALKLILKTINLNNEFPFINESTALTMYYGFLYYSQLSIDKIYILFIDIGHSKTSFIVSEFSLRKFSVKEVENIPFLGGRDLNNKIFEECIKVFEKENSIKLTIDGKVKYKFMEEIEKARINLTVNTETRIKVDAVLGEKDFEYTLTRDKFFSLIKDEINQFTETFTKFYNRIKDKYNILRIEMAGGAFKSIFQDKIIEITNFNISKTISLDECHSLGALLYSIFILEKNQFSHLKEVESYNMYSLAYSNKNNNEDSEIFFERGENYKDFITLKFGSIDYYNKNLPIYFFYKDNDFNKYFKDCDFLFSLNVNVEKIKKYMEKNNKLNYKDLNLEVKINQGNELISEFNDFEFKLKCDNLNFKKGFLIKDFENSECPFLDEIEFNDLINIYSEKENEFKNLDEEYTKISKKKKQFENELREIKKNIKNKNINNNKLNKEIRDIEKSIKNVNKISDLENIGKRISLIQM